MLRREKMKYPKIQSIYKRDSKTNRFIIGDFTCTEFFYLRKLIWDWREKINGCNLRVMWDSNLKKIIYGGRTDNAMIPAKLVNFMQDKFDLELLKKNYQKSITLYGEGVCPGTQGSGKYTKTADFILFDIVIDGFWLLRKSIEDIAKGLSLSVVPIVGHGNIEQAIEFVKKDIKSQWGDFEAEGIVLTPQIELFKRNGERIITKIKGVDF